MYYIIDIETFTVLRGPFLTETQAYYALAACRLKAKECYIVKTVEHKVGD